MQFHIDRKLICTRYSLSCCTAVVLVFLMPLLLIAQTEVCRTPGGRRVVIFEPCAYHLLVGSIACDTVARMQGYQVSRHIQQNNPGTNPDVTLQDFIDEMSRSDIGMLYIGSHGSHFGFGVEYYEHTPSGKAARDLAYYMYTHRLRPNKHVRGLRRL